MMLIRKIKKALTIIKQYDVVKTLWAYFKIPHPQHTSIIISKLMFINRAVDARINILKGRLCLNEAHLTTKKRARMGSLILGENSEFKILGDFTTYEGCDIVISKNAFLQVGDKTFLNTGVKINCNHYIQIGDKCAISDFVQILDTDYHTIIVDGQEKIKTAPIVIGNRVWIGRSAIILKGVTIGDGAVIGASSVVTKSIPPRCLAVGNPARVIKENIDWK